MERRRKVLGGGAALAALLLAVAAFFLSQEPNYAPDVHEVEEGRRNLRVLKDPKTVTFKPPAGPLPFHLDANVASSRGSEPANALKPMAKSLAAAVAAQPAIEVPAQQPPEVLEDEVAEEVALAQSQGTGMVVKAQPAVLAPVHATGGTFFIDVALFGEGISGWRVTLNQLLRVVEAIPGAKLVEPCMVNGRLKSCGDPYPEGLEGSPVPASEIFDLSWATHSVDGKPPIMARYGDYLQYIQQQREREVKRFHICLKSSQQVCPAPYTERWALPHVLESARNDNVVSVYTINLCWWGRCAFELDKHFLARYNHPRPEDPLWVTSEAVTRPETVLRFHPQHFQAVKDVLAHHNIHDQYSLIHWRAEKPQLDYLKCAQTVVEAKRNLLSNQLAGDANHPFLLMTSVHEDTQKQWNGGILQDIASNGSPKEALDILADGGFVRFDQLLREANVHVRDPGMLGVYELILATTAQYFSTCAKGTGGEPGGKGKGAPPGCSLEQFNICRECNYIGKFARLALDMRLESPSVSEESTMGCWPV